MFDDDGAQDRRRRRFMLAVYLVSALLHLLGGTALALVKVASPAPILDVDIVEAPKPKPEPKPEPEPEPEPVPIAKAPPAPAPQEAAPAEEEAAPAADFGLSLMTSSGPGGMAVAAPVPKEVAPKAAPAKKLGKVDEIARGMECAEEDTKPRPTSTTRPTPTDAARMAAVNGKVRLELTIDAKGNVISVRVLDGLGWGLDEAAQSAVREWKFAPGTHCGKPTAATFVVGLKFDLTK